MKVVAYTNPLTFQSRVLPVLMRNECVNCVPIGIIQRLVTGKSPLRSGGETKPLLLAVESGDEVHAVAIQTPPHGLMLGAMSDESADVLADHLISKEWNRTEITGPCDAVSRIAKQLGTFTLNRALRVFQLEQVIDPSIVAGRLRAVHPDEIDLLTAWADAFAMDIDEVNDDSRGSAELLMREDRIFFWDDNGPRAMAAFSGHTPNGIRVNWVYTPSEHRGRGYASNLVAQLSRNLLASGKKFCFLYTDLSNPTSNKIYQKIGYQPVADVNHLRFV